MNKCIGHNQKCTNVPSGRTQNDDENDDDDDDDDQEEQDEWKLIAILRDDDDDPKTKKKTETEVKPSTIVISFTNFQYSSPKMTVKVKASQLAKYKKAQKSLVKVYKTKNAKNKG